MTNAPHICFVAPQAYPLLSGDYSEPVLGGAELQQVTLAREFASRGYRVSMICFDFGQADGIEIDGITVHKAFRPTAGIPVIRFIHPRLTSVWLSLKRVNADIYYTRTAGMLTGVVAAFASIHGKKTVFAAADDSDFSKESARIRFRRDRWIYEWGLGRTDSIVVQNESQLKSCKRNFDRDATIIENCYVGPRQRSSVTGEVVLWVATIRSLKRPDRLIELARLLPGRQFVMVGGEDRDERPLYQEIKAVADNEQNIEFVGFVPYPEIDRYFDTARVFVNTSDSEGFPNTFLQSWARSIPTISLIDCGARLGEDPVGIHVGTVAEMASAIDRLFSDGPEYGRIGRQCRRYCSENHSAEAVVSKYESIFNEILEH